jgi:hypothetical protein
LKNGRIRTPENPLLEQQQEHLPNQPFQSSPEFKEQLFKKNSGISVRGASAMVL